METVKSAAMRWKLYVVWNSTWLVLSYGRKTSSILFSWLQQWCQPKYSWNTDHSIGENRRLLRTAAQHVKKQEALLPQTDRVTRYVSQNLANCCITVYMGITCTTRVTVDQRVINLCIQPWRVDSRRHPGRVATLNLVCVVCESQQ